MDPLIFIIHAKENMDIANNLKSFLSANLKIESGLIFVSSDPESIAPGRDFMNKILKSIEKTKVAILLLTNESNNNLWVHFEAGKSSLSDERKDKLIPIKCGNFDVQAPLKLLEFKNADNIEAVSYVLREIRGRLGKSKRGYKKTFIKLQNVLLNIKSVDFNYPDSAKNHGWNVDIGSPPKQAPEPTFTSLKEGLWGRVLKIESNLTKLPPNLGEPNYCMDYELTDQTEQTANYVKFIFKKGKWYILYTKIIIKNKDGSKTNDVWLHIQIGKKLPRPDKNYKAEWAIDVPMEKKEKGWITSAPINLKEMVKKTYGTIGTEGWEFDRLIGFRLRGNMQIAKILYYKDS